MNKTLLILLATAILSACGGGSNNDTTDGEADNNGNTSGSTNVSDYAGIYAWDSSVDGDVGYTVVGADGSLSFYDYAGDSFDNEGNCYWIGENMGTVTHNSGNQFTTTYFDGDSEIVTIESTSTGIIVAGTDEDGNWEDVLTLVSLNISDFTPECSFFAKPSVPVRITKKQI